MKYLMIILAATCVAIESGAAVCGGCKTKSNPDAKYCYKCGKKMPLPSTLDEKYEAMLREAVPILVAVEPEKDRAVRAEELVREEMAKFRAMSPARQKQEYDTAKATMAEATQTAKNAAAALVLSMTKETESEKSTAMAAKGRNLVVGIIQANTDREAAGLDGVWPKSTESQNNDKDDIAGMEFKNSTDYFRALFDIGNVNKKNWEPYVECDWSIAIPKGSLSSQWIVARGVTDKIPDNIPVIVSSNVDATSLISTAGDYKGKSLEGSLRFSGEWAVLVYKGRTVTVLTRKNASLANVYKQRNFIIPKGFGYLNP